MILLKWENEWLLNGYRVSLWNDKNILELDSSDSLVVNVLNTPKLYNCDLKDKFYYGLFVSVYHPYSTCWVSNRDVYLIFLHISQAWNLSLKN